MKPTIANGTPTRAAYWKPLVTARPPAYAPTALPKLNAIWMHAPPSISPPGATRIINNCSGLDTANSPAVHRNISETESQGLDDKKKIASNIKHIPP